jgi:signal transduction histidine kinase
VYRVTHDLKTPVNNVLLSADLLLESPAYDLADGVRDRIERIRSVAGRAEDMIHDLWRFVQITSEPEPKGVVELREVVERALEIHEGQIAAKGITVTTGALPRVWAGRRSLEHVMANLLGNAVKFVPSGSGVVRVSAHSADGWCDVYVQDNGIGIPEEYLTRIFDLYGQVPDATSTANGDAQGTGVGLAIVQRIVQAHGGTSDVESTLGHGSRFHIRLPTPPASESGRST